MASAAPETGERVALHDGWECAPARPNGPPEGWIPAVLPGDVRLSLIAAGLIPDPLVGRQLAESRWVAQRDWVFRRWLPPSASRRTLVFKGIDYDSEIALDGRRLGRFTGMFSERRIALPPEGGTLTVRCAAPSRLPLPRLSPFDRLSAFALHRLIGGEFFPPRLGTLKCQMSYGWDFAPELLTVGLWDDVLLHTTGPAAIVGVRVLTRPTSDGALAVLELDVDVAEPAALVAGAVVSGPDGGPVAASTVDWSAPAGRTRQRLRLALPAAERWEPWERGRAALYRVAIELRADGALSDRCEERFGIRTVAVTAPAGRGQGAPADDCVGLVVNGRTLFLRGANWTPNDALLGRLRDEDYRQRIEQAKAANINLLRVWGGGLREREAFYRACDEAGMLVWQEFPFSVAFFDRFPREPGYLALVEDECRGIVRALRNHPSVALWCGGNEFSPRRNRPVVDAIARAVAREDGSRPFRAASPGPGERHHWRVWHGKANVADYRKEDAPLLSEFGLQAPPNLESLRLALPEDERPGPSWEAHSAQLEKLRRYARTSAANVPTFIAASQRAQAVGLQVAIEHVRRRKGATTGTLFWQLNEPWPAITWSVIDYYGRPKLAYERLRGCYAPILVSLEYPLAAYHAGDVLRGTLWIVNDTPDTLDRLEVTAAVDGTEVLRRMAVAAPNAATRLGEVALRLPSAGTLTVRARRRGHVLSENVYDLGWHDPLGIRPLDAIRDWTTWRVLH